MGFKYLDSDGKVISSSLKTSRALAVESEQREKQEQPVAEKEKLREGAKKLLKEQEEKADLQVKQYLNEQKNCKRKKKDTLN